MNRIEDIRLESLVRFPLPSLADAQDKDGRGAVLVVAGGARVPGAGLLTGEAALRAGAGKLQMAAIRSTAPGLGLSMPEAAVLPVAASPAGEMSATAGRTLAPAAREADAVVVGPGMMDPEGAGKLARALIAAARDAAFVLDAAALTGFELSRTATHALHSRLVVTPHAGEMAKLVDCSKDEVVADPIGAATIASRSLQAVVVMKGAVSFIVEPGGRVWRHSDGVVGLATSGSGDVLAGVIGGLLARGAGPETAALWGVCVHARAGVNLSRQMGPVGFLARELLAEIPRTLEMASGA